MSAFDDLDRNVCSESNACLFNGVEGLTLGNLYSRIRMGPYLEDEQLSMALDGTRWQRLTADVA